MADAPGQLPGGHLVLDKQPQGMLRLYNLLLCLACTNWQWCTVSCAAHLCTIFGSFVYNFSAHLCTIFFQLICVQFLVWSVQIFLIVASPHGRPPRSAAKRKTMPEPHAPGSWVLRPCTPPHAHPPTLARHRARIGTSRIPRDLRPNV